MSESGIGKGSCSIKRKRAQNRLFIIIRNFVDWRFWSQQMHGDKSRLGLRIWIKMLSSSFG
ncbi:hypothetical protein [Dubosiella newyorkensis]|uniref:hypothetical protein n=1 Tax=Dubosiella newyorkensis TaxID=1862672 RepID=UPI003F66F05F